MLFLLGEETEGQASFVSVSGSRHFSLWSSYLCALVVQLQRAGKAVNCLDIKPRSFLCTSNYAGYIKPLTLCQHCFLLNLSGEHSYHRCGLVSNACLLRCTWDTAILRYLPWTVFGFIFGDHHVLFFSRGSPCTLRGSVIHRKTEGCKKHDNETQSKLAGD